MDCTDIFHDFLAKCNDSIRVYGLLTPLTNYTWIIRDKFDKEYSGEFTTDSQGFWEIDVEDLPEGLLTEYSGVFSLEVQDEGCKPVKMKIAQEYTKIVFDIHGGTRVKDNLGCDFDCMSEAAEVSQQIEFEDQTTVTITWDEDLQAAFGNAPSVDVYHETATPGTFQKANVSIQTVYEDGVLTEITIVNGGPATGYVQLS